MKVQNFYDREGHSEQKIKTEEELEAILKDWLKANSFTDLLKKEGIEQHDDTYGRASVVEMHATSGEIRSSTHTPGFFDCDQPFWIELARVEHNRFYDHGICEGAEMVATASKADIDAVTYYRLSIDSINAKKRHNNETCEISWWDNQCEISAKNFVEKLLGENWADWVDNYIECLLGDVKDGDEDAISNYFTDLAENNFRGDVHVRNL